MSVGLYKYAGNIFDDAEEILSENIASQRMYNKYLEPAIKELNIHYFQDGAEIRKSNLDAVMLELELLVKWVRDNVVGANMEYLVFRLQNIKKVILKSLESDEDVLYIFWLRFFSSLSEKMDYLNIKLLYKWNIGELLIKK